MSDSTSIDAAAAQITALLTEIETSNARVIQCQDNGTADNYVFAPTPAIASYGPDVFLLVDIANANLTTTPKLNVSGLGWVNITASDGSAVARGAVAGKCLLGFSSAQGGGYVARHMFALSASMLATLLAGLAQGAFLGSTTAGTATALTTTLTPVPATATAGLRMLVPITTTNGASPTLTFNTGAGNVTAPLVRNSTGVALAGNEMPGAVGYISEIEYDGTSLRVLNPAGPVAGDWSIAAPPVTFDGTKNALFAIPNWATAVRIRVLSPGQTSAGRAVVAKVSLDGSTFLGSYTSSGFASYSGTPTFTSNALAINCTVDAANASGYAETILMPGSASTFAAAFARYTGVNGSNVDQGSTTGHANTVGRAQALQVVGGTYSGVADGSFIPAGVTIVFEVQH